jgi:hypothetical protein
MLTELLVLSQAGELDAPAEEVDLEDAARRVAARWRCSTAAPGCRRPSSRPSSSASARRARPRPTAEPRATATPVPPAATDADAVEVATTTER